MLLLPYTVYNNAKRILVREETQVSSMGKWSICKFLCYKILLAWSETWKGEQCTLVCAILREVNFEITMQSYELMEDL